MADLRRKIRNEILNHTRDNMGRCRCGEHQSRDPDSIACHVADSVYQVVLGGSFYQGAVDIKHDFRVGNPPSVSRARMGSASVEYNHYDEKPYALIGGYMRLIDDPELLERDAADLLAAARWLREQREGGA